MSLKFITHLNHGMNKKTKANLERRMAAMADEIEYLNNKPTPLMVQPDVYEPHTLQSALAWLARADHGWRRGGPLLASLLQRKMLADTAVAVTMKFYRKGVSFKVDEQFQRRYPNKSEYIKTKLTEILDNNGYKCKRSNKHAVWAERI